MPDRDLQEKIALEGSLKRFLSGVHRTQSSSAQLCGKRLALDEIFFDRLVLQNSVQFVYRAETIDRLSVFIAFLDRQARNRKILITSGS